MKAKISRFVEIFPPKFLQNHARCWEGLVVHKHTFCFTRNSVVVGAPEEFFSTCKG